MDYNVLLVSSICRLNAKLQTKVLAKYPSVRMVLFVDANKLPKDCDMLLCDCEYAGSIIEKAF